MKTRFQRDLPYSIDDVIGIRFNPDALFVELANELNKRYGNKVKLIYAHLVKDIDSFNQFLMVFKQKITDKKTKAVTTLYAFVTAIQFGDLSLNMYALCKRDGKLDLYFKNFFSEPVVLEESKFILFIKDECGLSMLKTSEKYWKLPENSDEILKHLEHISKINYSIMSNKWGKIPHSRLAMGYLFLSQDLI